MPIPVPEASGVRPAFIDRSYFRARSYWNVNRLRVGAIWIPSRHDNGRSDLI